MAAIRSARRVVATNADRSPLETLSSNLRLNSSRLVVERLRACHLAWGHMGHVLQALKQAPDPPGCFDVVLAAGLLERCMENEDDAGATIGSSGGSGAVACGDRLVRGGVCDALGMARLLVEMHQCSRALPSVSATGVVGGLAPLSQPMSSAAAGGTPSAAPRPAPGAFAVLIERRGVLAHAQQRHGLAQALPGLGWVPVDDQLPPELGAWLAGPSPAGGCWRGPIAEHLDMLIMRPV